MTVYYAVGHKNPDTDSICSAILIGMQYRKQGIECIACAAGRLNRETVFVLDYFGIEHPEIIQDVSDKTIIMVDHNDRKHSPDGIEQASVSGIFDHHPGGTIDFCKEENVHIHTAGSTAGVIYQCWIKEGITVDRQAAGLIIAATLSDTVNLTQMTTDEDIEMIQILKPIAQIEDIDQLYNDMLRASVSYEGMSSSEIFYSNYKEYDMNGQCVGIACLNAANQQAAEQLSMQMAEFENHPDGDIYLMIRNHQDQSTWITGLNNRAKDVCTEVFGSRTAVLKPAVSRKQIVVPALMEAYKKTESSVF